MRSRSWLIMHKFTDHRGNATHMAHNKTWGSTYKEKWDLSHKKRWSVKAHKTKHSCQRLKVTCKGGNCQRGAELKGWNVLHKNKCQSLRLTRKGGNGQRGAVQKGWNVSHKIKCRRMSASHKAECQRARGQLQGFASRTRRKSGKRLVQWVGLREKEGAQVRWILLLLSVGRAVRPKHRRNM